MAIPERRTTIDRLPFCFQYRIKIGSGHKNKSKKAERQTKRERMARQNDLNERRQPDRKYENGGWKGVTEYMDGIVIAHAKQGFATGNGNVLLVFHEILKFWNSLSSYSPCGRSLLSTAVTKRHSIPQQPGRATRRPCLSTAATFSHGQLDVDRHPVGSRSRACQYRCKGLLVT
jgi:hypothetical protein